MREEKVLWEPRRAVPIDARADVCVCGGGCTGVFAAVRAARLGCSVILCEETNILGGAAVNGLVNIWHSLCDIYDRDPIIAGLTAEVLDRLEQRGALTRSTARSNANTFNPSELAFLLDRLAAENKIEVRLHTKVCGVSVGDKRVRAVFIEDGDGRKAIEAGFFIDCTGDGDLMRRLGAPYYTDDRIQPPSSCFYLLGNMDGVNIPKLVHEHGAEFGLADDWGWSTPIPGCPGITMRADNHVFGVRCDRARDLTEAEIVGRKQMSAFLDLVQKYGRKDTTYSIVNQASYIGIRETVHYPTLFKAERLPLLSGTRYPDAVLNGTYPSDVHHGDRDNMGITFWYLDGMRRTVYGKGTRVETGSWREENGLSGEPAAYYQVPFSILVQKYFENIIPAGRMVNADSGAFGALRVMVNLNQLGEAAGCAAAEALDTGKAVYELDGTAVRALLRKGGSAL